MHIGDKLQRLNDISVELSELSRAEKTLKDEKNQLLGEIRAHAEEAGLDRVATNAGTVYIQTKKAARVESWADFYKYIVETNQPHLLQRRLSNAAILELVEVDGELLPGTQIDEYVEPIFRKA